MIEFLDFNKLDLVATRVSGKITKEDFQKLKEELIKKFNMYGRLKWFYEMENFEGWELNTFFEDLSFSLRSMNKFTRVAFIGDRFIEDVMAKFYKLIAPAEVKFFDLKDRESAYEWIKYDIKKNKKN